MRYPTSLVRDLAMHDVVSVAAGTNLKDCALAMRNSHVGSLVLLDAEARPVGLITDRDIVVEAVAEGLDPASLRAGDIAAKPVATVRDVDDLQEALARMRECGVRRLPVVAATGHVAGVISLDDILAALADQFDAVARVLIAERAKERSTRP